MNFGVLVGRWVGVADSNNRCFCSPTHMYCAVRCTDHGNAMYDISNATTSHTTTAHMDMMKERSSVQVQFYDLSTFSQAVVTF